MFGLSVSLCPLVTTMHCAKMADSIKMLFGLVDLVGQRNDVLDPLMGRGIFFWGGRRNGVVQCNI